MQPSHALSTKSGLPQLASGPMTVRTIQATLGAALSGDGDAVIIGVNAPEPAQPGELSFAESVKYAAPRRWSPPPTFLPCPGARCCGSTIRA